MLSLADVADVLGVSKSTASRLSRGIYDKSDTSLPARYAALVRVVEAHRGADRATVLREVCLECDRQDCAGCRLAEI